MRHRIRTVRTGSGATAIQVVQYEGKKTLIVKHIGSSKNPDEIELLRAEAQDYLVEHNPQLSLFQEPLQRMASFDDIEATEVSHGFARDVFLKVADQCGLSFLDILFRDLAIMRIIEPCSKRRSIELIKQYFGIPYSLYVYERLPDLLVQRSVIEKAAVVTAKGLSDFALLLYDVTTLYFETHKPDDELQARGFSKDDKSKQPQIVIGLLVTPQGFPLTQEVFKGNSFEGHTMLSVVKTFQTVYGGNKPIIVADAAMLSQDNRNQLEAEGYQYIVGARLANSKPAFIQTIHQQLLRQDGAVIRLESPDRSYSVVCNYSQARYRKDKNEFEKQISKAESLIAANEPGRRAKFIKKSADSKRAYIFDQALKQKTEMLLGIKGYCTNIPEGVLSNEKIVSYYHELWHVEQAFRMSKSDLKARPIFHHSHESIRAHVLLCFMALMIGKFMEIKTGLSLRSIRDLLWQVHEVHLLDPRTGRKRVVRTTIKPELEKILISLGIENTH